MTWFKVDDGLAFHAKVVQAGNPAMGLWLRAGSWCAQQLTDGFVPNQIAATLGTRAQATALEAASLWVREDGGYRFHGWLDYQPTAAEVREDQARKHEVKVQAGRAGGLASGVARRKHARSKAEADAKQDGSKDEAKRSPDPTRPVPYLENSLEGGSHVSSARDEQPPLYSDRCSRHGHVLEPGNCGACADVRKANKARPLTLVAGPVKRCIVHDTTYERVCTSCRSEEIAAKEIS